MRTVGMLQAARQFAMHAATKLSALENPEAVDTVVLDGKARDADLPETSAGATRSVRNLSLAAAMVSFIGVGVFGYLFQQRRRDLRNMRRLNEQLATEQEALREESQRRLSTIHDLERTQERLRHIDEERCQILGVIAHDMRSPVGSIGSILELLEDETDPEEKRSLTKLIWDNAQYLEHFIDQIVAARRSEVISERVELEPVDMVEQMQLRLDAFRAEFTRKRLTCRQVIAPQIPLAIADRQLVREVFENLISNAVKYSRLGGEIEAQLSASDGKVIFRLHDAGPGVPVDEKQMLFTAFGRLSVQTTGGEPSVGLGLHAVRIFVEAMGGTVGAENHSGGGAVFWVSWPAQLGTGGRGSPEQRNSWAEIRS